MSEAWLWGFSVACLQIAEAFLTGNRLKLMHVFSQYDQDTVKEGFVMEIPLYPDLTHSLASKLRSNIS